MVVSNGGTYTLVIDLPTTAEITVGALGTVQFEAGWYAYVGSALGSGGFSRIERHRELAAGDRDTRHWHIDYLLGHPDSTLSSVVKTERVDGECRIAETLNCESIPDFGCSDCPCQSHLFYESNRTSLTAAVERAHEGVRSE